MKLRCPEAGEVPLLTRSRIGDRRFVRWWPRRRPWARARTVRGAWLALTATASLSLFGALDVAANEPPTIVVTTSMLEAAVGELTSAAADVEVVRLLPPGSCPGHFDLSPRSLPALRSADAILRHHYQGVLEAKLVELGVPDANVIVADEAGTLLVPSRYADLVRRVARILSGMLPDRGDELLSAAEAVGTRVAGLDAELRTRPVPWRGAPVIASFQQAEFSRWLGLDVVAEIGRPEDASPRDLERLLQQRPALVVGNLQEGLQSASAVADRLAVPLVVFSNFPGAEGYGRSYDDLLAGNVARVDEAWSSR